MRWALVGDVEETFKVGLYMLFCKDCAGRWCNELQQAPTYGAGYRWYTGIGSVDYQDSGNYIK